jgi:DNA-binding NarL/FixJ family response regulator
MLQLKKRQCVAVVKYITQTSRKTKAIRGSWSGCLYKFPEPFNILTLNRDGTIIIIEDDSDDQFFMEEAFKEIESPNERIYFSDSKSALTYLNARIAPPFLIISDINLPLLNGIALRAELKNNAAISVKCVPHLYLTTVLNHRYLQDAYCESAQGFFVKPGGFKQLKELLNIIMDYWKAAADSR